ncbi:MAG: heavy-metal-associated domain-containing protein [Burkholderiaceae bacterium]|nr:heavy-metal-associated domain-containing protein [Burkholderiaceae bacterium]
MIEFHLPDMSCGHCVAAITAVVHELDAQAQIEFDREARRIQVRTGVSAQMLAEALTEAGYPPAGTDAA